MTAFIAHLATLKKFLVIAFNANRRMAWLSTLLSALTIPLTAILLLVTLGMGVDAAVSGDNRRIIVAMTLFAISAGFVAISDLLAAKLNVTLREAVNAYLDREMLSLTMRPPGIEHYELPEYANRLETLTAQRNLLGAGPQALITSVAAVVRLTAALAVLVTLDPWLVLVPISGIPAAYLSGWGERRHAQALEEASEPKRLANALFQIGSSRQAAAEIRIYGLEDLLMHRFSEAWSSASHLVTKGIRQNFRAGVAAGIIFGAGFLAALFRLLFVASAGQITLGGLLVGVVVTSHINNQVVGTSIAFNWTWRALHVGSLWTWLETYSSESDKAERPARRSTPEILEGGIHLQAVSFRYPGTEKFVLHNIHLNLRAGSVVAIVGPNGAGKSTLVKLLCGFYRPTGGRILIDGLNLESIERVSWLSRISAVFQDFSRLATSVREVVGIGEPDRILDHAAVRGAIDRAGIGELVDALPSGIETVLGPEFGGPEPSGGEWQRLALARAWMRQRPLLLMLDEPTSSLDPEAESSLFTAYADVARSGAAAAGAIAVLITHRFTTVRMADVVVVLEDGQVVEHGLQADLLSREDGIYARMVKAQAEGYSR